MPLARIGQRLVYFAHVPKCAGTAIELYMIKRFGPLGLFDNRFGEIPVDDRWSRTSPQHLPEKVRQRFVPDGFIDASFAIVRHPALRLRSVFLFQREIEGNIAPDTEFSDWLETVGDLLNNRPEIYDGHLQPMTTVVPDTATVFALEQGLDKVIHWLDDIAESTDGPRTIDQRNVLTFRLNHKKQPIPTLELTDADFNRIADLYTADYDRFDYATTPETT